MSNFFHTWKVWYQGFHMPCQLHSDDAYIKTYEFLKFHFFLKIRQILCFENCFLIAKNAFKHGLWKFNNCTWPHLVAYLHEYEIFRDDEVVKRYLFLSLVTILMIIETCAHPSALKCARKIQRFGMLKVKWKLCWNKYWESVKNAIISWFWAGKLNIGYVQAILFENSQKNFEFFGKFFFNLENWHFLMNFIRIYAYLMPLLDKMSTFHQPIYFDLEIAWGRGRRLLKGQTMNFLKIFIWVNT